MPLLGIYSLSGIFCAFGLFYLQVHFLVRFVSKRIIDPYIVQVRLLTYACSKNGSYKSDFSALNMLFLSSDGGIYVENGWRRPACCAVFTSNIAAGI